MGTFRFSGAGTRFAVVLGVHVLVIAAIAQINPEVKRALIPIMVSFIAPTEPLPPVSIPRPGPTLRTRTSPTPVVPLSAPAPVTESLPQAISMPTPPRAPDPTPAISLPPVPVIAAPVPPPAPLPVVAPRFDAAYLNNPAPAYPSLSRRLGEHGRVMLRVYVNADGTTREVQLRTSSGSNRLDQAAKDAVERWRFVPARQGDATVGAWVLVPISFQLES